MVKWLLTMILGVPHDASDESEESDDGAGKPVQKENGPLPTAFRPRSEKAG